MLSYSGTKGELPLRKSSGQVVEVAVRNPPDAPVARMIEEGSRASLCERLR